MNLAELMLLLLDAVGRVKALEKENQQLREQNDSLCIDNARLLVAKKRYMKSLSAFHRGEGVPNCVPNPLGSFAPTTPTYNELTRLQANQRATIIDLQRTYTAAAKQACYTTSCPFRQGVRPIQWMECEPQ